MGFSTAHGTRVTIDGSGKVGIGITSPKYPLTVYSSANDISRAWVESHNTGNSARADVYAAAYTPTGSGKNSLGIIQYGSGTSGTVFGEDVKKAALIYAGGADPSKFMIGTSASIPLYFATAGTKRMTISSGGNVGIGTPSPSSGLKLDVEGKVGATEYCDKDGNNCVAFTSRSDGGLRITYDSVVCKTSIAYCTKSDMTPDVPGGSSCFDDDSVRDSMCNSYCRSHIACYGSQVLDCSGAQNAYYESGYAETICRSDGTMTCRCIANSVPYTNEYTEPGKRFVDLP